MRLELNGKLIVELSEGIDFRVKQRGGVTHLVIDFKVGKEGKEESQGRLGDTQVAVAATTKRKISPELSEDEKFEIACKYEDGTSTSQLAKEYSTTRARIRSALKEAGTSIRDERIDRRKHPVGVSGMPKELQNAPEKLEKLRELYESGVSVKKIADMLSIHYHSALRVLKLEGLMNNASSTAVDQKVNTAKRKHYPELSEEDMAEIVRKYVGGTSTSYLVERYSSTRAHIRRILEEAGIELRDERRDGKTRTEKLKKAEKDAIDHLHCMGMTPEEIAKEMGLNLRQIVYYLKSSNML